MSEKTRALAAVLLANFFFGTCIVAVKHITPSLISPIALTALRIVTVTGMLWLLYALKPVKMGISRKDLLLLFVCAVLGIFVNQVFSVRGMSLTSPVHASLLVLTTPITITILAVRFLKERFTVLKVLGLALGIAGGAMLVLSRDLMDQAAAQQSLGDVFVICGALSYSFYVVLIRPVMPKYKASHIMQWLFLFGTIMSLPVGWSGLKEVNWSAFDGLSWFALAYVIIGATFFAYQFMNYSISKLGATLTGSFIYTQPFFATLASVIIMGETLNASKVLAGAMIMGGVFLANWKKNP